MGFISRMTGRARTVAAAAELTLTNSERGPDPSTLSPHLVAQMRSGTDPGAAWVDGGRVPRTVALQVPVIRRGVNLISGTIGSFPLTRWRNGEQIPAGTLLEQPELWRPYCRTIAETVADLVLYKYAWWMVIERDPWTGYPTHVVRLDPEYVTVQHQFGSDEIMWEWATYMGEIIDPINLLRFDGPDDGLLTCARGSIMTALTLEQAAARYASPDVPTGILKQTSQYDLTDPEVDRLMERWSARFGSGSTRFLNPGLDYQSVQSSAVDLQLVEARGLSDLQLARHMSLPPRYLAVSYGSSMNYSNLESERRDLIELAFIPYLNAIEQRLSMNDRNGSPRGQKVRFDLSDFSRGVPLERAQRYATLLPLGVMSVEEARAAEAMDATPTNEAIGETPGKRPSAPPALGPTPAPADPEGPTAAKAQRPDLVTARAHQPDLGQDQRVSRPNPEGPNSAGPRPLDMEL